jgi:hypothetical protein
MFRVSQKGEGIHDADTIQGAREIVRGQTMGRYDVDEIRGEPFPSGHGHRQCRDGVIRTWISRVHGPGLGECRDDGRDRPISSPLARRGRGSKCDGEARQGGAIPAARSIPVPAWLGREAFGPARQAAERRRLPSVWHSALRPDRPTHRRASLRASVSSDEWHELKRNFRSSLGLEH